MWWGSDDNVALNQAWGLNPVTQAQLDRTVDISIQKGNSSSGCTGTMLTYQTVLTAAHCVDSATGLLTWPTTLANANEIRVGLTNGVDTRLLAVPPSLSTNNLPWAKPLVGPFNSATSPRNRDYAILFLESPEQSLSRRAAGTTLDDVLGAADPEFFLPTASIGNGGTANLLGLGYGATESAWNTLATTTTRQAVYLTPGVWQRAGGANGWTNVDAGNNPYPDQPIMFRNWPPGTGVDPTGLNPGQIEGGYFFSDGGDSGGPLLFDLSNGRMLFALHQSGLTPTEFQARPGQSTSCASDPQLCQPSTYAPACWGADGTAGTADDGVWGGQVDLAGNPICIPCSGLWTGNLCDANNDGTADFFRQTPDNPFGSVPNVPTLMPGLAFPATPSLQSCQNVPALCQPITLPVPCYGADGILGNADDTVWTGTYNNGAPVCLACAWTGNQCDTNGDGTADFFRQTENISTKVDLSMPTVTNGVSCTTNAQCDTSLGYSCGPAGTCVMPGPREWILNAIDDRGRPGRLFGERDYVGP